MKHYIILITIVIGLCGCTTMQVGGSMSTKSSFSSSSDFISHRDNVIAVTQSAISVNESLYKSNRGWKTGTSIATIALGVAGGLAGDGDFSMATSIIAGGVGSGVTSFALSEAKARYETCFVALQRALDAFRIRYGALSSAPTGTDLTQYTAEVKLLIDMRVDLNCR